MEARKVLLYTVYSERGYRGERELNTEYWLCLSGIALETTATLEVVERHTHFPDDGEEWVQVTERIEVKAEQLAEFVRGSGLRLSI